MNSRIFINPRWALYPASVLVFLFAVVSISVARTDELPKGVVIDKVVCQSDSEQSYALYLPSTYTSGKSWPIIYAFDPGARGPLPVRLFQQAAEKYGYVIASSNNSRNGMQTAPLRAAIAAIIEDTRKRFSIDEKRIYTAGFSGGARVATRVASSCNGCIAGVIACGAGFPSDIPPSSKTSFVFYATVGNEDFNYPELKKLGDKLVALKIPNHITIFDGEHRWASSQLLIDAVEWMEIQAIRAGRRERDESLLESIWQARLNHARAIAKTSSVFDVYSTNTSLIDDFRDLRDVSEYEKKAAGMRATKEVKQALGKEAGQLREQQEIADRLISFGSKALADPSERTATMRELKSTVEGLMKKAHDATDLSDGIVVRRALFQVSAQTFEAALYSYLPNRQFDVAVVNLMVAEEVTPKLAEISYELARAYALKGEKKLAIEAVRRAVEKGLTDASILENQKDFDTLRSEMEFKAIITRLTPPRTVN